MSYHLHGHSVQGGLNAMHKAAAGGHLEVIKYLSPMFGVRIHEKTEGSYTMLHCAAQGGHSQVARYLIEVLKMDTQDRDKVCALDARGGEDMFLSVESVFSSVCCSTGCCNKSSQVTFCVEWHQECIQR